MEKDANAKPWYTRVVKFIMKGGKSFQDRMRTVNVRNMALDHIEKILSPTYKDKKYQKELLLRLAPNLLPRLNEVTGADGKDLPTPIFNVQSYNSHAKDILPHEAD